MKRKLDMGKYENQYFSREGVRDDVLMKRLYEFLRLVTFHSLGLTPQLENRGIFLMILKGEFLSNEA